MWLGLLRERAAPGMWVLTPASHLKWTGSRDGYRIIKKKKLTDPPCLASNNTKLGTSSPAWSFVNVQTGV
jgi:hypothetical protein